MDDMNPRILICTVQGITSLQHVQVILGCPQDQLHQHTVPNQPIQLELARCLHKICTLEDLLLPFKEIVLQLATLSVGQVILQPLEVVVDTGEIMELMEVVLEGIMAHQVPVDMGCHKVAVMECIDEKQTKRFREKTVREKSCTNHCCCRRRRRCRRQK